MALYDNKHWLLAYIRNSFITTDDSGLCEAVMICDNIAKQLPVQKHEVYPATEEDEYEDDLDCMAHSFDLNSDLQFGLRRHRSNTAQRLEKMEEEKKKAAQTIHVKWISNPLTLSQDQRNDLFPRKPVEKIEEQEMVKKVSFLTELLEKFPNIPENPFKEFAKFDGNAQVGVPTRMYHIFLTMLDENERRFPMEVSIVSSAKVFELIGLICWKCSIDHPDVPLLNDIKHYGLYIAEDDGDVDWDFPCLDSREVVCKFGFNYLAMVEKSKAKNHDESYPIDSILLGDALLDPQPSTSRNNAVQGRRDVDVLDEFESFHFNVVDVHAFESYTVYLLSRVRTKTEVQLGISEEKVDIYPVVKPLNKYLRLKIWGLSREKVEILPVFQQKVAAKLLGKKKSETLMMDDIVSCDLTENKTNNRSNFRIIFYHKRDNSEDAGTYKYRYFDSTTPIAATIVRKVNCLLELKPTERRREYFAQRDRKSHRRKNFHLGPR